MNWLQSAQSVVSSVQLLSRVLFFETPWTVARQAFLSITNSQSLLKLMSITSVMTSNHLLCCPLLLLPSILPRIRVFQWVGSLHQVAKVLDIIMIGVIFIISVQIFTLVYILYLLEHSINKLISTLVLAFGLPLINVLWGMNKMNSKQSSELRGNLELLA